MCNWEQCAGPLAATLVAVRAPSFISLWDSDTLKQVNAVLRAMTRSRLIQVWFATMSLVVATAVALGVTVTIGTAAILVALSLVPPAIGLALWPGVQPMTAADVLYGRDRRD